MGKHGYNHGDLGWSQLNTPDPIKSVDFYANLIGYEKKGEVMPGYHVLGQGEESIGGITGLEEGQSTPSWMPYITVTDLDATLAKAKALGAAVMVPPSPLPDCGRFAIIRDPQGGMTGLAQYSDAAGDA